jgi:hypothetical protein
MMETLEDGATDMRRTILGAMLLLAVGSIVLSRAIADYTRAIELNQRFAKVLALKGLVELQQGKDADAQQDFDAAFRIDSSLKTQFQKKDQ